MCIRTLRKRQRINLLLLVFTKPERPQRQRRVDIRRRRRYMLSRAYSAPYVSLR